VGYCTQVSVKRTGARPAQRLAQHPGGATSDGHWPTYSAPVATYSACVASYKCAPKSALLEPGLDSLQADGDRVRISPGFACPSCLVQSRCLRSVTVSGRRLRFVLLVAVGPEVPRVTTHSDRGLGWNLVPLRTRGITRSLTMHGLPISESPLHSAPILPRSVHGFEQLN
ncbi:unnamed protein product, partial [Pelagomonas calceolata]